MCAPARELLNLLDATAQQVGEAAPGASVLVSPHHVGAAAAAEHIVSVAGYPSGRHHLLIKAAEARLAVQSGAAEIWACPDPQLGDANALLAELVTVREACPAPVRLGLIVGAGARPALAGAPVEPAADPSLEPAAEAARLAGFDYLVSRAGAPIECALPVVAFPAAAQ